MLANDLMINKLELVKKHFTNMVSGGSTTILVEPHVNENSYHFKLCGQNDTIGNVLQSHIVNHFIDENSLINFCGYKKSHPLEEYISLYLGLNPSSNVIGKSEELKLNAIVKYMDDVIEDLIEDDVNGSKKIDLKTIAIEPATMRVFKSSFNEF